jgi:TRL (tRNA-associated locus)-like protein
MRSAVITATLLCLSMGMVGCAGFYAAPVVPPQGMLYTNISAPVGTEGGEMPQTSGEASSECILGLFAWGDAGVKAAADNGGLTSVDHVDYKFWHVMGVYSKFTTVAYGK